MKLARMLREPKHALQFFSALGWPGGVGALLLAGCLVLLGAAWHMDRQARLLAADGPLQTSSVKPQARQFARASEAMFTVPADGTYLDDLQQLFKMAKAKGINIGNVEYRQESDPLLKVLVRTLDVRIQEDYPRLKAFMSTVLETMPHASVREVRVDRRDATTTQGQIVVRLAFVYRRPDDQGVLYKVHGR